MTQYIVSARKYRPETFDTLIGQDNIAQTLKNSIIRGQLAHAYLFCGPRGVGKTTTARIFAKAINCSDPTPEMEPCGHCESCLSFAEGRSYCIHELDAASNNGVDDIKALMDQVRIPPQVGKYSVYIIDEVHMLSQAAFNAFLKTLEEPPAHAIFILATTEKHKILPTILSRCQTYDFNRITVDNIVKQLRGIAEKEGVDIDDESLHVIANKADGAMRDALTIFDQTVAFCGTKVQYKDVLKNLNVLDYEYSFSLTDAFLAGDYPKAFLIFDEILAKGFNALHFVAALSSHFRDLTVSKSGGLAITTACESGYRSSINPRLHIEFALMKLSSLSGTLFDKNETAPKPAEKQPEPAAQSQAPAMAPEQEDPERAEQPVTRRTRQAKASVLSVKSMTEESGKKAVATEEVKQMPSAELTEETIREKWQELAKLYEKKPRLSSAISTAALECSEDKGLVTFRVFNTAQRDWIESKCLLELEGHFQRLTGSSIKLRVDVVAEEDTAPVAYMPSEKAQDLMNKNEEVKNLVKDLGLDIK